MRMAFMCLRRNLLTIALDGLYRISWWCAVLKYMKRASTSTNTRMAHIGSAVAPHRLERIARMPVPQTLRKKSKHAVYVCIPITQRSRILVFDLHTPQPSRALRRVCTPGSPPSALAASALVSRMLKRVPGCDAAYHKL